MHNQCHNFDTFKSCDHFISLLVKTFSVIFWCFPVNIHTYVYIETGTHKNLMILWALGGIYTHTHTHTYIYIYIYIYIYLFICSYILRKSFVKLYYCYIIKMQLVVGKYIIKFLQLTALTCLLS